MIRLASCDCLESNVDVIVQRLKKPAIRHRLWGNFDSGDCHIEIPFGSIAILEY